MSNTVRLRRARQRAEQLYPKSTSFQGAYMRGARAALKGNDSTHCPYKVDTRGTWRRSYRLAWMRGHQSLWDSDGD